MEFEHDKKQMWTMQDVTAIAERLGLPIKKVYKWKWDRAKRDSKFV